MCSMQHVSITKDTIVNAVNASIKLKSVLMVVNQS